MSCEKGEKNNNRVKKAKKKKKRGQFGFLGLMQQRFVFLVKCANESLCIQALLFLLPPLLLSFPSSFHVSFFMAECWVFGDVSPVVRTCTMPSSSLRSREGKKNFFLLLPPLIRSGGRLFWHINKSLLTSMMRIIIIKTVQTEE